MIFSSRPSRPVKTRPVKVACASLNQTVYDYARNIENITTAIKLAAEDQADILLLPELSLSGYSADDYHQWNKDNTTTWQHLSYLASYCYKLAPNLILSVGAPWHYADKTLPAADPLYNINNRPFNTQIVITGGRVVALSAKALLADGPVEFETRQFLAWPTGRGTLPLTLPDGSTVPFGKPVLGFGETSDSEAPLLTLYHEHCAEAWPGIANDLSIHDQEQQEARLLATLSQTLALSLVLNPSASRPEPALNKELLRMQHIAVRGSEYADAYVYTNVLGSESGLYAAEGSQIYAQAGKIVHHGQRYSFKKVAYSSKVLPLNLYKKASLDAYLPHRWQAHEDGQQGEKAAFERVQPASNLMHEEYLRSVALWLRDYLSKQTWPAQGYVISLSGGADSAYGAIAVTTMIELGVKEEGVRGFLQHFPKLSYKDEALAIFEKEGEASAVTFLKKNLLTCLYLPTENSSATTLTAARLLVEGGTLPDGSQAPGVGGRFSVHPVQKSWDEYLLAHVAFNMPAALAAAQLEPSQSFGEKAWRKLSMKLPALKELYELWLEARIRKQIRAYVNADLGAKPQLAGYIKNQCSRPLPSWSNPGDNLTLQNYQARVRLVLPWAIANQEGKIPLVTSNASEAALGYTTAGGDMHMGGANPIGGIPKATLQASLLYLQNEGLVGLHKIAILHFITTQAPTAELRKIDQNALEPKQSDEGDLGFTYLQSRHLERLILTQRQSPLSAYREFLAHPDFPADPLAVRKILLQFCGRRWPSAQFKRVMAPLAPYVGGNFDPHASLRSTVLGDHFDSDLVALSLQILADKIGGEDKLETLFGFALPAAIAAVQRSPRLKEQALALDFPVLSLDAANLQHSPFIKELQQACTQAQLALILTGAKSRSELVGLLANKRLAIFAATLNPPTRAHEEAIERLRMRRQESGAWSYDYVYLHVPEDDPSGHYKHDTAPWAQRLALCQRAFQGKARVLLSELAPLATVSLLMQAAEQGLKVDYVLGADNLAWMQECHQKGEVKFFAGHPSPAAYKVNAAGERLPFSGRSIFELRPQRLVILTRAGLDVPSELFGIPTEKCELTGKDVSSTRVRNLVKKGDLEAARALVAQDLQESFDDFASLYT